jgi:hypothetical protein
VEKTEQRISISPHAIQRYRERLHKEHLSTPKARREIEALVECSEYQNNPPEWLKEARKEKYGDGHCYIVCNDIVFPARHTNQNSWLLMSCITRGSMSPERRKARNKYKHIKRSKRGAGLRRWNGR